MDNTRVTSEDVMAVLRKCSTGMVVDALAMSGIKGAIRGVRPVRGFEDIRIIGPAATVLFSPPRPNSPRLNNYRAILASEPGSILVIDGQGRDEHFTGDNQGELAKRHGLQGIVVYGGARDIGGYRAMGMPLYCTGSATADKSSDLVLTAFNVPIQVAGVEVKPGDIVVADEDGVVAIPAESVEVLIENLKVIFEVEHGMEEAIASGSSLADLSAIIAKKKPKK